MNPTHLKEIKLDVGTKSIKVRDIPSLFTFAIHGEKIDWAYYMESYDLDDGQDQRSIRMTEHLHLCHLIDAVNNGDLTVHTYMTLLPITRLSDPILRKEVWKKYRDNEDDYFLDCIVTIDELVKYAERYSIEVHIGIDGDMVSGVAVSDTQTSHSTTQTVVENNYDVKSKRLNRLYEEISEITDYLTIGKHAIRKILMGYINKNGSCIKELNQDSIIWIDSQGNKQITTTDSLSKWLSRQNRHKADNRPT